MVDVLKMIESTIAHLTTGTESILKQPLQASHKTSNSIAKHPAGSFNSLMGTERQFRKKYLSEERLSAILLKIVLDNLRDELYDAR